jgi:hypothetical protein
MTTFIKLLADSRKELGLRECCNALRTNRTEPRVFSVHPESFRAVPGAPFAYWVSENVRELFAKLPAFETEIRTARQGLATAEDFRFLRLSWEEQGHGWYGFAKGGTFSPFYADVYLEVKWENGGEEIKTGICQRYPYLNGNAEFVAKNTQYYFRPGLTWPRRTKSRLSMRAMPSKCIFADKGPVALVHEDDSETLFSLLAICTSDAFHKLVEIQLAAADARPGGAAHSFEVGVIQKTPVPVLNQDQQSVLARLARRAWSLGRNQDTIHETSHAFHLPAALRSVLGDYDPSSMKDELDKIRAAIDDIAFDLYGFTDADCGIVLVASSSTVEDESDAAEDADDSEDADGAEAIDQTDGLLSWATGVAFGRFDWRLATGEREAPPEPDPFDPLPAKSPGMLPDDAEPFHTHSGILVDDQGHPNDLARLIEEVLVRVDAPVPADVRRWLQRDFFPLHLRQYSKSRRKAPIYWPLSTNSGSYTLWLYYPNLTDQALFTAVNDFIEPKLKQVDQDVAALRSKGSARSRDDEKTFEALQALELELIELRDTLLAIAQTYRPNHDDGVQITAAPLWQLFRHKPWQKILKDTWAKLEKGDYDWAHLARAYWPDRVREKCKTDKSLAIAHDLEHLYVEPEAQPKKAQTKKTGGDE